MKALGNITILPDGHVTSDFSIRSYHPLVEKLLGDPADLDRVAEASPSHHLPVTKSEDSRGCIAYLQDMCHSLGRLFTGAKARERQADFIAKMPKDPDRANNEALAERGLEEWDYDDLHTRPSPPG